MIKWKGWGILGLLPLIVACIVFTLAAKMGFPGRGDGPQTGAVMMLVALGVWWLGRRLNARAENLRDAPHSLHLIPLQFYGIPLFAAGALMTVATLLAAK